MEYLWNGIWSDPENDRYVTQDGESWLGLEDAQAHMDENYWSQSELPMQDVISDLKDLKVENFGVLPEYLTSPIDERGRRDPNFDLFDSSTWNVPTNIEDRTYVGAPGVKVPQNIMRHLRPFGDEEMLREIEQITDPIERQARIDEFDQQTLERDIAFEQSEKSMIDVLAEDNPEIRTGFFPRKYYPEVSTSNLSDYLKKGFRVRKTGISEDAAGHYAIRPDEIGLKPTEEGSLPSWDRTLEIMGHEGIHMAYPHHYTTKKGDIYKRRGLNALQHTLPWPENWSNPILAGTTPKAAGHEAMLNMDKMFFPEGMRSIDYRNLNRKGVENLNAITSWTPNTMPRTINERPTGDSTANMPARRPTHHFNTGGIAGLPGQWTPSMAESEEEEYNIKPLQLDPGIMSIEDLADLFEEAGLDKSIIYTLINSGGLSQLLS
jgi:hypothetical protein